MTAKDIAAYSASLGKKARACSFHMRKVSHKQIVSSLKALSTTLIAQQDTILKANKKDLQEGKKQGLSTAMLDRLALDKKRLQGIAKSVKEIAGLPNPLAQTLSSYTRKDALKIDRISVPIGAILFIYESRPNVTIDGAALCIKSGNSVILRGGKEAAYSNAAFVKIIRQTFKKCGLPIDAVQYVVNQDYQVLDKLLVDMDNIDLVVPRGGEKLIKAVVDKAKIPVIKHYKGVCHIYVDKTADIANAEKIILNAKTQRPGVCNAMETLLLDTNLGTPAKRQILETLIDNKVEVRGCPQTKRLHPLIKSAKTSDWDEEYLDLILSVKQVNGVKSAIDHINIHGSGHTDAIIARSKSTCKQFTEEVDSSSVMVNASTRFSDGGEYGLGAEVGISTDKLHARGPMGIESLTTYQWQVTGNGHIRT
ncbi:MAG: glutamate-5-semialdehyde dehydrogenase [Fibrobacteria bacterium]|nr:glutamate-5-semialdehyde dehydrogenase [Fibrobacteria bacterium]